MRYVNRSRYWRQAGDMLVPPGGITPELETAPIGPDWEPVTEGATAEEATERAPAKEEEETKEVRKGGRK